MKLVLTFAAICLLLSSRGEQIVKQNEETLTLSCQAKGFKHTFVWKFNGTELNTEPGNPGNFSSDIDTVNGDMVSKISRPNIEASNAGVYECYDKYDSMNELVSSYTVTIISISGNNFTQHNNDTDAEFRCQVDNEDLIVKSLSWSRNDEAVENKTNKYAVVTNGKLSTLQVKNLSISDSGLYQCVVEVEGLNQTTFTHAFSLNTKPQVQEFEKIRGRVEDEKATIECKVLGYPVPEIRWERQLEEETTFKKIAADGERIKFEENKDGVPAAQLVIENLKIKEDRGDYKCVAENFVGSSEATVSLKVKDKLAAVWPFLGICAEVAILCSIIFIFEKRRSRKMEEEEEVDAVKQDLMSHANGGDDKELRQRNNARS